MLPIILPTVLATSSALATSKVSGISTRRLELAQHERGLAAAVGPRVDNLEVTERDHGAAVSRDIDAIALHRQHWKLVFADVEYRPLVLHDRPVVRRHLEFLG